MLCSTTEHQMKPDKRRHLTRQQIQESSRILRRTCSTQREVKVRTPSPRAKAWSRRVETWMQICMSQIAIIGIVPEACCSIEQQWTASTRRICKIKARLAICWTLDWVVPQESPKEDPKLSGHLCIPIGILPWKVAYKQVKTARRECRRFMGW